MRHLPTLILNADIPSEGVAGDWTDDGVCATAAAAFVSPPGAFAVAKPAMAASKASTALGKTATVTRSASSAKETAKNSSRFFKAERNER